ncbi:hypothetical protein [Sphingomonas sp. G-3-2-10]|uniref:DUF6968 family protein n=1 Tax=Sphingomonas sp. G-3-2-10 TaxID=2728838 RepID=UPI00146B8611|nr:hypothetical protein [Sphingomonas sp. G-3-2-10]NML04904.1 hypothetical protein [Sphingomonas sp. G-3-2-10]
MEVEFTRYLSHRDGKNVKITVLPPEEISYMEWKCHYRIDGIGKFKEKISYGIDAIQAFYLSLIYISTEIYSSDDYKNGNITWEGASLGDIGLPISNNILEDVKIDMIRVKILIEGRGEV